MTHPDGGVEATCSACPEHNSPRQVIQLARAYKIPPSSLQQYEFATRAWVRDLPVYMGCIECGAMIRRVLCLAESYVFIFVPVSIFIIHDINVCKESIVQDIPRVRGNIESACAKIVRIRREALGSIDRSC